MPNSLSQPLEALQAWLKTHTGRPTRLYAAADEFDEEMHPANLPGLLFFPLGVAFASTLIPSDAPDAVPPVDLIAATVLGTLALHGPDHPDVASLLPEPDALGAPRGMDLLAEACGAHFFAGIWAQAEQIDARFPPEWIPRGEYMQTFNERLPARMDLDRHAGSALGKSLAQSAQACPEAFASGFCVAIAQSLSFQHCHRYQADLSVQRSLFRPGSGVFLLNACLRTMCEHGIDISPAIESGLLNTKSLSRLGLEGGTSRQLDPFFSEDFDMTRAAFEAAQIRADLSKKSIGASKPAPSI